MKIVQSEELESQRLVKQLEVDHPEILTDVDEYKAQSDALEISLAASDLAVKAQANINDETVSAVELLLKKAVDALLKLNTRATSKAVSAEDTVLEKLLKKSFTFYYCNTKEICVQRLEAGVKLLKDNSAVFTNLLPADFTDINAKIAAFKTNKDVPADNKATKKSAGTSALDKSVKKGKKQKNLMVKLLVDKYAVSNPALAEKAKIIGKTASTGTRHNTGVYSVRNAHTGNAIATATITEIRTSKKKGKVKCNTYIVDGNGQKIFNTHTLGKAALTTVASGFVTLKSNVIFKKNELNEFVIEMVPV